MSAVEIACWALAVVATAVVYGLVGTIAYYVLGWDKLDGDEGSAAMWGAIVWPLAAPPFAGIAMGRWMVGRVRVWRVAREARSVEAAAERKAKIDAASYRSVE